MNMELGFKQGEVLANKYVIISHLGGGWEGEVFKIREKGTQIDKAAKFFFPKRNKLDKTATNYAQKLHKLRNCSILIKYHNFEKIIVNEHQLTMLISEFAEGQLLTTYLKKYRGNCLPYYQGLHLLYALVKGLESIHKLKEYHGDMHADNVIIERSGPEYKIKLLDLFNHGKCNKIKLQYDIISVIKIFYDSIGGSKKYAKQPPIVKQICCGLKKTLILKKYKTITHLRIFLESNDWS